MDTSDLYTSELETNELKGETKPIDLEVKAGGDIGEIEKSNLETKELEGESQPVDFNIDTGGEIGEIEEIESDDMDDLITGRSVGEEIRNTPIKLASNINVSEGDNKIDFQQYELKNIKEAVEDDDVPNLGQVKEIAGDSVEVVQTYGNSTTAVMSQAATTAMISPVTTLSKIQIGKNSDGSGADAVAVGSSAKSQNTGTIAVGKSAKATASSAIAIGNNPQASGNGSIAIGGSSKAQKIYSFALGFTSEISSNTDGNYSIALGSYSKATRDKELSVGSTAAGSIVKTRFIANVTDPQLPQDAATKNYVDSMYPVGCVYLSTSSTAPTFVGTWTSIGSQTIGSSTVYYYERTA